MLCATAPGRRCAGPFKFYTSSVRLDDHQRVLIKQITAAVVGREAEVRLFGSRVRDDLKGGDIDLLVRSPHPLQARLETELTLGARLERALGGRRVDVLLIEPASPLQPVHLAALETGVVL